MLITQELYVTLVFEQNRSLESNGHSIVERYCGWAEIST